MDSQELTWLISSALQVTSLAIGLAVIGFGYDRCIREKKSFTGELTQGAMSRWLAFAAVIFTVGILFTKIPWGYKAIAIVLSMLLIGLSWSVPQAQQGEVSKPPRSKPTVKSISWLLVRIYFGIFLMLFLVWGINLGWHAAHLYRIVKSIQADPSQIQIDKIPSLIDAVASDIGTIYNQLNPLFPIFNSLRAIPGVGPYMGQVEPLLDYANGLAQASNELTVGLRPLLADTDIGQAGFTLPEQVSQIVQSGQVHFSTAADDIDQARLARNRIQPELMPESLRANYLMLDGKLDQLQAGVYGLLAIPELLGNKQAQNYLVLAQNRDELRGTGGFISGIGLLTIKDGKILEFNLGDSYQVDDFSKTYPTPPEPLKRFMLADYWVTRDSNWSPDFPSASQQAQALYTLSTGIQTQGVIAFNQLAIKRLLEVIGPIQVPGIDDPVTAENVEVYMQQAWAAAPEEGLSEEWWNHRKDFMQQMGSAMLEKAMQLDDQKQLLNMSKAILDLLEQGQVMIYLNDPSAQAALEIGGWDGGVRPGKSDYLYLVDSNVGFNKVDSVIKRSVDYRIDLTDLNRPVGNMNAAYQHTGSGNEICKQAISYGNGTYPAMQQRCYLDYWRVYVPSGSNFISGSVQPVPAEQLLNGVGWSGRVESFAGEAGTQVWAGLLMLPIAQTSQIEIMYSLPSSILQTKGENLIEYTLRVQVQPGLEGLPFKLEIMLPNNSGIVDPGEGWTQSSEQTWTWQGVLDKITDIKLTIQTDQNQ